MASTQVPVAGSHRTIMDPGLESRNRYDGFCHGFVCRRREVLTYARATRLPCNCRKNSAVPVERAGKIEWLVDMRPRGYGKPPDVMTLGAGPLRNGSRKTEKIEPAHVAVVSPVVV